MSLDQPNIYEQAIEDYAAAVRHQRKCEAAALKAGRDEVLARNARQEAWRKVSAFVNQKKIEPGVYRLKKSSDSFDEGLLIEEHHDYPEVFPMFR